MRKLMFAVAAMTAGIAMADVSSANIVGYQEITVPTGYSLYTVTFKDVGSEVFDIQNMEVWQNGEKLNTGAQPKVTIQKMLIDGKNSGSYDSNQAYLWKKLSKWGWFKVNTYCTGATAVNLGKGEAFCVYNSTGASVQLRSSGEVELQPNTIEIPTGYSLMGNMTPVDLDIQNIEVWQDGELLNPGAQPKFTIQKMLIDGNNTGSYDAEKSYIWKKLSKLGWYKVNTYCTGATAVSIAAGEGFSCYNNTGSSVTLKFKSPISE